MGIESYSVKVGDGQHFDARVKFDKQADIFVSYSPIFKIYSQGRTIEGALKALIDAIESYILVSTKYDLPY